MDEQFPLALAVGTNVNGYVVNKVIGQGGFGITYLAYDTQANKTVALKEYLPQSVALRNETGTVTPYSVSGENDFEQGKESFLKEAQTLGKFRNEAIVQVLGYFEANGTAYTVMEFAKGDTLSHRIKQLNAEGKTMPEEEIMTWFTSAMDGLECVHKEQFLHRDIKPDNIMLDPETGKACLLDFGAARHDAGGKTKSMSVVLTPGFAPIEQYSNAGKGQGTWTDVYALGATVWCAMTGQAPTDAPGRSTALMYQQPDPIVVDKDKLIEKGYSDNLVNTVVKMLEMNSNGRLQTIAEVRESLGGKFGGLTPEEQKKRKEERLEKQYATTIQCSNSNDIATLQKAVDDFKKLGEYKDSASKVDECLKKIDSVKANLQKAKKKKLGIIVAGVAVIAITLAFSPMLVKMSQYKDAAKYVKEGNYKEAIAIYEELGDFKDTNNLLAEARKQGNEQIYQEAMKKLQAKEYKGSLELFSLIKDYKDSRNRAKEAFYNIEYNKAKDLIARSMEDEALGVLKPILSFGKAKELYNVIINKRNAASANKQQNMTKPKAKEVRNNNNSNNNAAREREAQIRREAEQARQAAREAEARANRIEAQREEERRRREKEEETMDFGVAPGAAQRAPKVDPNTKRGIF
ncbi:MAG: protein kinase [Synergistaceae bacterium]|nr:protein kinase [Synergistaceae bacterium]